MDFIPESPVIPVTPQVATPAAPKGAQFIPETGAAEYLHSKSIWEKVKESLSSFGDPLDNPAIQRSPAPEPRDQSFIENRGGAATGIIRQKRARPGEPDPTLGERAGQVAGAAMQTSDMLTSIGKQVLGAAPYWAVRNYATHVKGETPEIAAEAAQMAKDYFFPPELSTPWAKVADRLGPAAKKAYNENPIAWVMGKVGEVIEHGADTASKGDGQLKKQDIMAAADQLMGSLFWRQLRPEVQASFKTRIEQMKGKPTESAPVADGSVAERIGGEPLDTNPPKPDAATRKAEIDAQLKEAAKAKSAVNSKVKEAAKFTKMAEKLDEGDPLRATLEERAQIALDEAAKVKEEQVQAAKEAAGSSAEERFGGSTYDVSPEAKAERTSAAAEVAKLAETPGHLRSPEQMIQLRGALKRMKEAGFSDAKVAAGILAGTVTGTALWKLYQTWAYKGEIEDAQKALDDKYNKRQDDRQELRRRQDDYNRGLDNLDREPPIVPNPKNNPRDPSEAPVFTAMQDMSPVALAPFLAAGWVKAKGGMWHPEAVERLASPLATRISVGPEAIEAAGRGEPVLGDVWAEKAVKNYLNKHAGTESDPLRDVELPSGKTWGEVTDKLIVGKETEGPRGKETQWDLDAKTNYGNAIYDMADYLSHVGDFLRQNVDPAKLAQYDLVRAVKETAANDARVAKEMERAAAASTKDMPVYKDYGDGMKWVELKLPKKLSEEQASRIRKSKSEYSYTRDETDTKTYDVHEALDAQGKPIVNSYTNEVAQGATPEEAHLAGQLAQEGNQMGHCVGGYCADVASGQTRILSLRDAKGRSHVTVEIQEPQNAKTNPDFDPRGQRETHTSDILQIKGKQNRAPNAEYLPYVQDLVKGGKWGEVGDLGNTGLTRGSEVFKFNDFRQAAEKAGIKFEDDKYYSKADIDSAWEKATDNQGGGGVFQKGSADPRLLAGIAAAGGIAAYTASHPDEVQNLAALGLLALPVKALKPFRESMTSVAKGIDYALGATSTRLGNISPALRLRARDYERRVLESTEQSLDKVQPFLQVLQTAKEGSALDLALLNGDGAKIATALKDQPAAQAAWKAVQGVLKSFEEVHREMGRFKEGVTNYFPRIVSDLEGLKKALGQEQRTSLEDALMKAEAKMIKEQQRSLTDVETSLIVNNSLHARPAGSQLPGFAHSRKIEEVTQALRPFYAAPTDSLLRYVSAAIQDAEMARFFGRDLASRKIGGKTLTDVDASIGNVVGQELKAGRMDHTQANELRELLKARFEGGEQTMAPGLQDLRNATNVALLGQFGSAATQIGDSVMTIYHHGLMPTLQALKQKLTGDSQVTGRQFGIVNHIAEELGSNRWTGKALQLVFKANGFAAIDQFAKGLNLNAGLVKNQRLAGTERGRAELAQKYAVAFGEEFPQLLQDLAAKQVTPRVKSLLFSELSDAQPLTKMEMPQAYLENPNGRLLYQMKTYMLKQMDVIRRDAFQEIAKGNYVRGAKNLVAVSAALALSNIPGDIIKDWISGRDVKLDKIDYVEALLRNFGVSRYSLDQVSSGKPLEVLRDMALPPYKHFQELLNAALPGAKPQDEAKAAKYVPLVGRAYYDRELGGNEARKAAELLRLKREARDAREAASPLLKDLRLRKQEAVRQRKLQRLRAAP